MAPRPLRATGRPGVAADIFNAVELRLVRRWWPEWRGMQFLRIVESKLRLVSATPPEVDRCALAADIELLNRHRATPGTAEALLSFSSRDTSVPAGELGRYLERDEGRREREDLLDFEDMTGHCIVPLEEHAPWATWFAETSARSRWTRSSVCCGH